MERRKAGRAECNYPDRTELLWGLAADGSRLRAWRCGIGPRVGSVAWSVPDSQLWLVSDRAYRHSRCELASVARPLRVCANRQSSLDLDLADLGRLRRAVFIAVLGYV